MTELNNVVCLHSGLKEPKGTCAQCRYFRRVEMVGHTRKGNPIINKDYCIYPIVSAPGDKHYISLVSLKRCKEFVESDHP